MTTVKQTIIDIFTLANSLKEAVRPPEGTYGRDIPDELENEFAEKPEGEETFMRDLYDPKEETAPSTIAPIINKPKKDPVKALIKQYLKTAGISDASNIIWGGFSENSLSITTKLVTEANSAIDKYKVDNPDTFVQKLPETSEFITSLETSLAKLHIIYTSWYVTLGLAISPPNARDERVSTLDYALAKARRELTQNSTNDATKNTIRSLFKNLSSSLQERILRAPDKTGLKKVLHNLGFNLLEYKNILALLNTYVVTEARLSDTTAVNKSGTTYFDELINISQKATLSGIVDGLLPLVYGHSFSFEDFEVHVKNSFFNVKEEEKLIDEILTKHKSSESMTADTEAESIKNIEAEADENREDRSVEPELGLLGNEPEDIQVKPETIVRHLHGAPRGIKLFNEIDNSNFARLFDYLITNKYVVNGLDVITVPPSKRNTDPVKMSLIQWLNNISNDTVEARTKTQEVYYNISTAVIDFISIFAEVLDNADGSSLPISQDKLDNLTEAITAFGAKYQIPSLQIRVTAGQAAAKKEAKTDFFSIVMELVNGDTSLTPPQKTSIAASLKNIQELPSAIERYIGVIRILFEQSPKIAYSLPSKAVQRTKENQEEYKKFPQMITNTMSSTSSRTPKLSLTTLPNINELQKFGINIKTPVAETLLFSTPVEIQYVIEQLEEFPIIETDRIKQTLRNSLKIKLQHLKDIKTSFITEAILPTNKKDIIHGFIQECLPLLDNMIIDARKLVTFIRNIYHSSHPLSYFPETDIFADNMGDFSGFRSALVNADSVPTQMVRSIINAFMYNESGQNDILSKEEAFKRQIYPQDIERLSNILSYMFMFIKTYLWKDEKIPRETILGFIQEIEKVKKELKDASEVNLDKLKEYFKVFKNQLFTALYSKKGEQNTSMKTLERLLTQHVLGDIVGIARRAPIAKEFKSETKAQEDLGPLEKSPTKEIPALNIPDTENTYLRDLYAGKYNTGEF